MELRKRRDGMGVSASWPAQQRSGGREEQRVLKALLTHDRLMLPLCSVFLLLACKAQVDDTGTIL